MFPKIAFECKRKKNRRFVDITECLKLVALDLKIGSDNLVISVLAFSGNRTVEKVIKGLLGYSG